MDAYYMNVTQDDGSSKNWVGANLVVGVQLPEPAHVVAAWVLPRSDGPARLDLVALYGAASEADLRATNIVMLANVKGSGSAANVWNRYVSTDVDSAFLDVFMYSPSNDLWNGDMAEMYVVGWSAADGVASGSVAAPDDFRRVTGAFRWTSAANAEAYTLERRPASAAEWTAVTAGLDGTATSCRDETHPVSGDYEYRLVVYGLDGKMIRATDPIAVTVRNDLLIRIL